MSALGVPNFDNVLRIDRTRKVCLVVFDGLGWEALWANQELAPFLASQLPSGRTLTAGFPSTTATSVASIGMGQPPGEHGLLGFTMALPGQAHAMNVLRWTAYGTSKPADLTTKLPPEQLQPQPTALETASKAGVDVTLTGPAVHEQSGLSRAALRGGRFVAAVSAGDLVANCLAALQAGERSFIYAHHNDMDTAGHARGVNSDAWRFQLRQTDRLCQTLVEHL
ncbi:MAG TPA: alkaline phosphatase family protein, partial [Chloroflexota bacterium]|nr:alkaline phosphatase family protein [Chloroflexota bacterium]